MSSRVGEMITRASPSEFRIQHSKKVSDDGCSWEKNVFELPNGTQPSNTDRRKIWSSPSRVKANDVPTWSKKDRLGSKRESDAVISPRHVVAETPTSIPPHPAMWLSSTPHHS